LPADVDAAFAAFQSLLERAVAAGGVFTRRRNGLDEPITLVLRA
jgi:hypothetical protein